MCVKFAIYTVPGTTVDGLMMKEFKMKKHDTIIRINYIVDAINEDLFKCKQEETRVDEKTSGGNGRGRNLNIEENFNLPSITLIDCM